MKETATSTRHRIEELDYLKCILIVLMISFHLVYISELYPYAKQVVYTFHMPIFLVLSGFLMNVEKSNRQYLRTLLFYFIPYFIMESGYIAMASLLPIREHIDNLTITVFLNKLLLHPLGPYWYLHTLVICGFSYLCIFRLFPCKNISRYILLGILYAMLAYYGEVISLTMSFYFLAGIIIRHSGIPILQIFRPSWLALAAFVLLVMYPANLNSSASGGILIAYLFVCFALAAYPYISFVLRRLMLFVGRNTLSLLLFSPIFTILCKSLVPILSFDASGMIFLVVSLIICIVGSLLITFFMDGLRLSPFFFGRQKALVSYT